MSRRTDRTARAARWAAAAAAVLVAGAALAGGKLQRLPADHTFTQGDGSPGKVTFSHQTHVDADKPACLACHPRGFKMLEAGQTASGARIQHADMEKGLACGACHGKTAFGFDACDNCHRS